MSKCYIITVEDGANFQALMRRRVFLNEDNGRTWARAECASLQQQRRDEGETDLAFVNAIEYHVTVADLDEGQ